MLTDLPRALLGGRLAARPGSLDAPKAVQPHRRPVSRGAVGPNLAVLAVLTGNVTPPKENPGGTKRRHCMRANGAASAQLSGRDSEPSKILIGRPASGSPPSAVTSQVSCMYRHA